MKLAKSVPSSTTTVPPPVKRRMTGTARARAASVLTSFSTTPLMPMTMAGGPSSPWFSTAQLPACERSSASSSRSWSKMCVPTSRSTLSTGLGRAIVEASGNATNA